MLSLTLHSSDPLSIFPLYLFPFFSLSFSLTLRPNELCSLVVIGSQMCCRSCQCKGMVCEANTHKLTQSHCQLIKTVTMHKCLCCYSHLSYHQMPYSFMLLLFLPLFLSLSLPHVALQPTGISSEVAVSGLTFCAGTLRSVINSSP